MQNLDSLSHDSLNFFLILTLVIVVFSVIVILNYQTRRKQRDTPFFNSALLMSIIAVILYLFGEIDSENQVKVQIIALQFIVFFFYFMFKHFDAIISKEKLYLFGYMAFGGLVFASTINTLLFFDLIVFYRDKRIISQIATFSLGFLSLSYCVMVSYKTNKFVKEPSTKIEMISMIFFLIGSIIWLLNGIYSLLFSTALNYSLTVVDIIANLFFLAGSVIFTTNYLIHRNYLYRIPIPIYKIMVIKNSGIPVYSRNFKSITHKSVQSEIGSDLILSGFLSTIPSILNSFFGKNANIGHINASEYDLFFCQIPDSKISIIFITSGMSVYLKKSIENLSMDFNPQMVEEMELDINNLYQFEGIIDLLIQSHFPFLNLYKN